MSLGHNELLFGYVCCSFPHDDVIKWKHFPRNWPFVRGIHRSPVNSPHKDQWRGALMFSLICVWINGWVNNREAGDLRRYRAHYDVIVMTRADQNLRQHVQIKPMPSICSDMYNPTANFPSVKYHHSRPDTTQKGHISLVMIINLRYWHWQQHPIPTLDTQIHPHNSV